MKKLVFFSKVNLRQEDNLVTEGIKLTSIFILSACDVSGTGLGP